jgi:hypothetical protein
MKIIRYSKDGFKPQYQSYHLQNHVDYHLNHFNIADFPKHLQPFVLEQHNKLVSFYTEHLEDLQRGVWAFIDGYKNNMSLNHLKERVPCWEAEIPNSTIVIGVNWDHAMLITDSESTAFGFYIPEQQMKYIQNVRRRTTKW